MLVLAHRCPPGQHAPQDPRLPAPAPGGLLLCAQRPPLLATAAAGWSQAGRGEALSVSGSGPPVVPSPRAPGGLMPWRDLRGVGGRSGTLVSVILSSWAPPSLARDGGGWFPEAPTAAGRAMGLPQLLKTQPMQAQLCAGQGRKDPLENLPAMVGSPGLREGKALRVT